MNLRKDHCRNLLERLTVGHVHLDRGRMGALAVPVHLQFGARAAREALPHCGELTPHPCSSRSNDQTNSGVRSAKENGQTARVPDGPGDGVPLGRAQDFNRVLHQTTLGNGYLGSRIDEERSEMRYLV